MRKTEFMDLLKYYFRKEDKGDLKGILEDCDEQFRLGAKEGKTEEEICVKLGHPKNIYRYYIGKPIVPEDNESLKEATVMPDFDDPQDTQDAQEDSAFWGDDDDIRPRRSQHGNGSLTAETKVTTIALIRHHNRQSTKKQGKTSTGMTAIRLYRKQPKPWPVRSSIS